MNRKKYGGQSTNPEPTENLDELLTEGARLISTIYQELNQRRASSTSTPQTTRRTRSETQRSNTSDLNATPPRGSLTTTDATISVSLTRTDNGSTSTTNITTNHTPQSLSRVRARVDADIERINRYCDSIDQNLRMIGLSPSQNYRTVNTSSDSSGRATSSISSSVTSSPLTYSTPERLNDGEITNPHIVDLSLYDYSSPHDSDVFVVGSNRTPEAVIDLCTPTSERRTAAPSASTTRAVRSNPYSLPAAASQQRCARRRLGVSSSITVAHTLVRAVGAARVISAAVAPPARSTRSQPTQSSNATSRQSRSLSIVSERESSDESAVPNSSSGSEGNTEDEPYRCPICFENPRKRQPTSTRCGHVFCNPCITTALSQNRKCPMCNSRLTLKQLNRIFL